MDCVAVRTKLQAVIVQQMVREGLIPAPFHLVKLYMTPVDHCTDELEIQCRNLKPFAAKTTVLDRSAVGTSGAFLYFLYVLIKSRAQGHRVFLANVNWLPVALALKCLPGWQISTFDDGTANVQKRDTSYLSEMPSMRPGLGGWIARKIFPRGCSHFTRSRIIRHCTIYADLANIVPRSRLDTLELRWEDLLAPEDVSELPQGVNRIFLGSVYAELNHWGKRTVTDLEVAEVIGWADLHIPHPRQAIEGGRSSVLMKYPAESIISHYAELSTIFVAHYNSSVALSFRSNPRVRFIDLFESDVSELPGYAAGTKLPTAI